MSGQQVGSIVGAVIGNYFFPGFGGFIGGVIGGAVGSQFDPAIQGPRLNDLKVQSSEYGRPIPITYGTFALQGNVIWASDLVEVERDVGGKGGPEVLQYEYYANFAVALCEGEVTLGRIWAGFDKRLIWDGGTLEGADQGAVMRFYPGSEDQLPDPLIESYLGVGNVPAYRGTAYVVFEHFPVMKDGNRIPFLTCEVGAVTAAPQALGYVWPYDAAVYDGKLSITAGPGSGYSIVQGTDTGHTWYHGVVLAQGTGYFPDIVAFDPERSRKVIFSGSDSRFVLIDDDSGVEEYHNIDRSAFPSGSASFSGSVVYHLGKYIFGMYPGGTQKPTIAVVDPDSLATEAVYTYSGLPANMLKEMLVPADPAANYVLARSPTSNVMVKLPLANSPAVSLGTYPHNNTYGSEWGVDGATGYVYVVGRTSPGFSTSFTYSVHDPVSDTKLLETTLTLDNSFRADSWFFIPHDIDGKPRIMCVGVRYSGGHYWDHYLLFGDDGSFYKEVMGVGIFPSLNGGRTGIMAMAYDAARKRIVALRDSYAGAIVAESEAEGGPETIPQQSWIIGVSTGTAAPRSTTLDLIVADLSDRAGLTADQIDVTSLADDEVKGYAIATQTTCAEAIRTLMPAYFFDAVESGGQVKFVKRGGEIAAVIEDDDLGAYESGSEAPDPLETTRIMDEELPANLTVRYILEATNYDPATKLAKRLVGNSGNEASHDFPIVMTDTKAQQIADVNLHVPWIERLQYRFSVPRKYADLEPTTVVGVRGHAMRIVTIKQTDGRYACEAVHNDSNGYTPNVVVTETPPAPTGPVETPSETVLELMDINAPRDADTTGVIAYAAAVAADPDATWAGALLYGSSDEGASYSRIKEILSESTMGYTTNTLGDFHTGNIVDELNTVNVMLRNGSLSSTTNIGLLNATYVALIGDELVPFRDATVQSDGSYTVRGLIRGWRGTEGAMGSHSAGERFILLDATLSQLATDTSIVGVEKLYKGVSAGSSLASTDPQAFTINATNLKPYSPVHLGGGRDGSNNLTLTWLRRAKRDSSWRNGVDVPLDESTEGYVVEIYDGPGYASVLRTEMVSSAEFSYSAATQSGDGLTPGDAVYFKVYQLSSIVGRGHAATGSV